MHLKFAFLDNIDAIDRVLFGEDSLTSDILNPFELPVKMMHSSPAEILEYWRLAEKSDSGLLDVISYLHERVLIVCLGHVGKMTVALCLDVRLVEALTLDSYLAKCATLLQGLDSLVVRPIDILVLLTVDFKHVIVQAVGARERWQAIRHI